MPGWFEKLQGLLKSQYQLRKPKEIYEIRDDEINYDKHHVITWNNEENVPVFSKYKKRSVSKKFNKIGEHYNYDLNKIGIVWV